MTSHMTSTLIHKCGVDFYRPAARRHALTDIVKSIGA
jgi:hypothetical protein